MEPEIYIGIKVFFTAVAVTLVTTATLRDRTRRVSFWVAWAFVGLAVFWSALSVSLLVYPSALQLTASSPQAIYFFAFGALAPALACAAGLATLTRR